MLGAVEGNNLVKVSRRKAFKIPCQNHAQIGHVNNGLSTFSAVPA